MQLVQKVCSYLTQQEILEIGEDPAYFFGTEKYKRIQVLFDSGLWTSCANMLEKHANKELKHRH